jgi:hypothetical protein
MTRTLTLTLALAAGLGSAALAGVALGPAQIEHCRLAADEYSPSGNKALCAGPDGPGTAPIPCHDRYLDACLALYQDPDFGPVFVQLAEAEFCSRKAAISYSSEQAESAETIANAAFDKCVDSWREQRRLADIWGLKTLNGKPSRGYHMTLDDDRKREVEKLRILVFEVRAAIAKH